MNNRSRVNRLRDLYWQQRRRDRARRYFQHRQPQCVRCGKQYQHLHHAVYDRPELAGFELDQHLHPVCRRCHHRIHRYHRTRYPRDVRRGHGPYGDQARFRKLEKATLRVIRRGRRWRAWFGVNLPNWELP